jgi:hypothetical protein
MLLGLSLPTFTLLHVAISLTGIFSGFVVLYGMVRGKRCAGWTAIFLATTVLTSVTGFLFPMTKLLPSHITGIISLVVLAIAIAARYGFLLQGAWRWVYVVTALIALYLNVFVGVIQSFQKLSFLQPLAPTQSEPSFLVAQLAVLVLFVAVGWVSLRRFYPVTRLFG